MIAESSGKVAYVVKRYPRYSETFIVNEILAHEAAGLGVEIFSLYPPVDTHFQDNIALVRAPVHYLPGEGSKVAGFWSALGNASTALPDFWSKLGRVRNSEVRDVVQGIALARLVRERGISHLHAHFGSAPGSVARIAALFAEVSYSLTLHAKDIFHESVNAEDLGPKLADASAVVTVSDYNASHLRREFGTAQLRRIYNGVDLSRFRYAAPAGRPPLLVAVGRLVEKKGFVHLIEACHLLAAEGCSFSCRIIGGGEMEAVLRQRISDLALVDKVQLLGPCPQSEATRHIQQAALLAAPCVVGADGNRDGLPTVLIEAMALGTPCVATEVTGIPEIVQDGITGLLVPQADAVALAGAIKRLLHDANLRVALAEKARALVEAEFEIHSNAAKLRKLFRPTTPHNGATT